MAHSRKFVIIRIANSVAPSLCTCMMKVTK